MFWKKKKEVVFKEGDKVGLKDFDSDNCYLVKHIVGDKLYLHCATYLLKSQAILLPPETELKC